MSQIRRYRKSQTDPEVSICIPTLDLNQGRVGKLLALIEEHSIDPYEVVIYDCEGELQGYTRPQNEAMKEARGDFMLALNDDIEVTEGWLEPLLREAHRDKSWCVTPDMTHSDGPQIFHPYCMLWQRGAWEEMGGLDEQFIFWGSDLDIARRLVDRGYPPVKIQLPIPIRHVIGATATDPEHQSWINENSLHDLERFRQKWGVSAEEEKYRLRDLVWHP